MELVISLQHPHGVHFFPIFSWHFTVIVVVVAEGRKEGYHHLLLHDSTHYGTIVVHG